MHDLEPAPTAAPVPTVPHAPWMDEPTHALRYNLPALFALAPPMPRGTRVLDIGCGNGHLANYCATYGARVVGIDGNPNGIAVARAFIRGSDSRRCRRAATS
jgi:2-polyprenyl-3-methyl-5-hydroxy-6-metoxy-1,4-benzoquinol methylase